MAKVIINTGEYCKTTLKLSIDISEASQYDMNKIIIISWFIGSQQTQHVQLHNGGLDHVRQLTRSKHGGIKGERHHLATAMDP